jgi:type IV pilus assembly protein PilN
MLNLLPHRQWAMARKRKAFAVSMVLAALVGVLVAAATSVWLGRQLAAQRLASSSLQQAIAVLDGQLKDKAQVKTDLVQLRLRETSLQALRDESQLAGALLQELAAHLPEGLYLTALTQDGDKVRINGAARSGQEVFELLRQMASGGQWLVRPELIEVAAAPTASVRQGEPVGTPFSMRAWLQRPELPASTLD